jgi:hypothetical protein
MFRGAAELTTNCLLGKGMVWNAEVDSDNFAISPLSRSVRALIFSVPRLLLSCPSNLSERRVEYVCSKIQNSRQGIRPCGQGMDKQLAVTYCLKRRVRSLRSIQTRVRSSINRSVTLCKTKEWASL